MKTAYFDASAIVKLIVQERESTALIDYFDLDLTAATSKLSITEVIRAVRRHGITDADAKGTVDAFVILELTREILETASLLNPPELRTVDAIHLATALSIDEPALEVVTYDHRFAQAAGATGLTVVQPGR